MEHWSSKYTHPITGQPRYDAEVLDNLAITEDQLQVLNTPVKDLTKDGFLFGTQLKEKILEGHKAKNV